MKQKHLLQVVVFVVFTCFSPAAWAGGAISSGETKTGTLNAPAYQDSWTFSGTAGDRVVVTATGTSTAIYPEIYLNAPGEEDPEASATGIGTSKRLDHQLEHSGTYTIVVRDWNRDTTGTYAISLAKIPGETTSSTDTDGGNISSAQTRTGNFNLASDTDLFQFTADSVGERVVITVTGTGSGIYPEIFLYPPGSGAAEANATGLGSNKRLDHQLEHSGLYTIVVQDYALDTTGGYAISLAKIPGAVTSDSDTDGGNISSAQTRTGNFNLASDTDLFQFTADSVGERVVITVTGTGSGIYPEIFLYPPGSGAAEANATGLGSNKRLDHQLEHSGLYTIVVQDYALDTTGGYAISLAKIPGAVTSDSDTDGGNISSAQTRTGNFNLASDTDLFQFTADSVGERVVITVTGTGSGIYPEIFLYPPGSGAAEANATGLGSNKRLDHQLEHSGLYTIVVQDYALDTTGGYAISLAKIPGADTSPTDPDGGIILPAQTLTGNFNLASDTDIFQFCGKVGDLVVITATGTSAGIYPEIYLYPPEHGGASEVSATGIGTSKRLDHQLLQSGTYTIVVQDWSLDTTGTFNIALAKTPSACPPGIINSLPPLGTSTNDFIGHLSWDAVPDATGYDVYFGVNGTTPLAKIGDNVSTPMLALPDMDPLTVYYWQVVAHTPSGDIPGPVQWFKTGIFDCEGDFGNTGNVGVSDLVQFLPGFGRSDCNQGTPCDGDFDGDFDVDGTDIANFIADFGRTDCPILQLMETFTSGAPGWAPDGSGTWSATGGAYRMTGIKPAAGVFRYSFYSEVFGDFTFQVDITKVQGVDAPAGILFRSNGTFDNLYAFRLDTDGSYIIGKRISGTSTTIIPSTYSSAINKGLGAVNKLRVACHGETLQFYINDHVVNVIEDLDFASGKVGVYAWDDNTAVNIVQFDNAEVYSISTP